MMTFVTIKESGARRMWSNLPCAARVVAESPRHILNYDHDETLLLPDGEALDVIDARAILKHWEEILDGLERSDVPVLKTKWDVATERVTSNWRAYKRGLVA